jgi:aspartate aminotransferase-like enzyme
MVALSPRAWKRAGETHAPNFYFDLTSARDAARNGETPWTPPISIVFALDVALQRYHAEGMQASQARHARLAEIVRDALTRLGFTLVSRPGAHSPTVVAAYPPSGVDAKALLKVLREKHGVVLAGGQGKLAGKIVRFGTMGDIRERDVETAVRAIGEELGVISGVA